MANLCHLSNDERRLVWRGLEDTPARDMRFRNLVGELAWSRLPKAIKRRFSRHMEDGKSVVYKGIITNMKINFAGKLLAKLCRLIGSPLPTEAQENGTPAIVTVTEDKQGNGQFWTRTYGRKSGFPQVIHSSKRFQGPTGLEEFIGHGITMDLAVKTSESAITFESAGFHFKFGRLSMKLPRLLEPGKVTVTHKDEGEGYFAFILEVTHPLFGELLYQRGIFCEHEMIIV